MTEVFISAKRPTYTIDEQISAAERELALQENICITLRAQKIKRNFPL